MEPYSQFGGTGQQPLSGGTQSRPLIRAPGWRTTLHSVLNRPSSTELGRRVRAATLGLIILSTLCFVMQSLPSLQWGGWQVLDVLVAIVFTFEYGARMLVAPDGRGDEEYDELSRAAPRTACESRVRFALEPMSIIDLLSIAPFWLELFFPFAPLAFTQFLRALRLMRVLRMLRLAQANKELRALVLCVSHTLPALRMLLFFLVLELVVVGGLVFHAERGNGPSSPKNGTWYREDGKRAVFQSIPDAAWFTLVTLTTVGYGEEVPHTWMGRLVAALAMLTGMVGISSIISIFAAEMTGARREGGLLWSKASRVQVDPRGGAAVPNVTATPLESLPAAMPLSLPSVDSLPTGSPLQATLSSAPPSPPPSPPSPPAKLAARRGVAIAGPLHREHIGGLGRDEDGRDCAALDAQLHAHIAQLGRLLECRRERCSSEPIAQSLRTLEASALTALLVFEQTAATSQTVAA